MYTLYYWKVAKEWLWFVMIFAEGAGVLSIICTFFLPESPKFLISKKHFNVAREAINFFRVGSTPNFSGLFDREVLDTYGDYSPFLGGGKRIQ